MKKIRFAVVGTNFISDRFVEAVSASQSAEIEAIYSRKLDTGRGFADKYGVEKVYTDYLSMLSDVLIDAVYVASPTVCHFKHAKAALLADKHVLCEKMITTAREELSELIAIAGARGLVLLEAMRPDFDPAYELVRESIARIAPVRRATLEFCQYSSRYDRFLGGEVLNAFDPKMKNSALADIGIYPLHTAVALFGSPCAVSAHSVFLHNGFEGAGNISLDYGDKQVGVVYSKISDSVNPSVIEGERGSLTIDKISAPTRVTLHPRGESPVTLPLSSIGNNMLYEVEAFAAMVRGESGAESYLNISLATLAVVEKAYSQTGAAEKM